MVVARQAFLGQLHVEDILIPVAVLKVVQSEIFLVEIGESEWGQNQENCEHNEAKDEIGVLETDGGAFGVGKLVALNGHRPDDGDILVLPDLVPEVEPSLPSSDHEQR